MEKLGIEIQRKKIGIEIIETLKKEMIEYLEKTDNSKFSLIYTDFLFERSNYIENKVKEIRNKMIDLKNITNDNLFKLYLTTNYDGKIFNEKYINLIESEIVVKANNKSEYDNYYKNNYLSIIGFVKWNNPFGKIKTKDVDIIVELEEKKLNEIFEIFNKEKVYIYLEEKDKNNYRKSYHKRIKDEKEFIKIFINRLRSHYYEKEEDEIYNYVLYNFINPFFKKIETIIKKKDFTEKFDNPFGFFQIDNNFLLDEIKNFKI